MCPQKLFSFGVCDASLAPEELPHFVKCWLASGFSVLLEDATSDELQSKLDKIVAASKDGGAF